MLTITTTPASNWQTRLRVGDVVSFRFPLAERKTRKRGKARPCLVLSVADHDGVPHAVVVYGTSADTPANRGHDLPVTSPSGMAAAGLRKPTRFVGARRVCVPLTSPCFRPQLHTGSPILGHLAAEDRRAMLDVVRAILREPARPARRNRRRSPPAVGPRPRPSAANQSQPEGLPQ